MTYWRQAGLTYIQFSSVASRLVRKAIKSEFRVELPKGSTLKQTVWKDGKALKPDA